MRIDSRTPTLPTSAAARRPSSRSQTFRFFAFVHIQFKSKHRKCATTTMVAEKMGASRAKLEGKKQKTGGASERTELRTGFFHNIYFFFFFAHPVSLTLSSTTVSPPPPSHHRFNSQQHRQQPTPFHRSPSTTTAMTLRGVQKEGEEERLQRLKKWSPFLFFYFQKYFETTRH